MATSLQYSAGKLCKKFDIQIRVGLIKTLQLGQNHLYLAQRQLSKQDSKKLKLGVNLQRILRGIRTPLKYE